MNFTIIRITATIFIIVTIAQVKLPMTKKVEVVHRFDLNLFLAALAYFGVLIIILLIYHLFKRNAFIFFHLKQELILFTLLTLSILVAKYIEVLRIILFIMFGVIEIFAMLQASRGYYWRTPFVGKLI